MQESVQIWLTRVSKFGIAIVILSTLFLFTNLTTDFYDTPKFLVLLIFTGILLILTTLKFALSNKVVLVRTPLDLPLLLLLAVAVTSTVLSPAPYVSLLGQGGLVYNSLAALITYILFYFVVVNNLKSSRDVRGIIFLLTLGGALIGVASLLAYAGVKLLPPPWNHGVNFTPIGSNFSATAVLALLVPIISIDILDRHKLITKLIYAAVLVLFGTVIVLTGTFATIIAALVGIAIILVLFKSQLTNFVQNQGVVVLGASLVLVALVVLLSFIPPIGNSKNPLYILAKNFPRESQLPFVTSWKISVSSFRDTPFWGSGPASYLFDFTSYKTIEFNNTSDWNRRFDTGFNEYLSVLATLGGVGLVALIFATAFFASSIYSVITNTNDANPNHKTALALAVSGIVFFVILLLHSLTLPLSVIGFLILACFMVTHSPLGGNRKTGEGIFAKFASTINLTGASSETVRLDTLPTISLTIAVTLVGFAFFFGGKFALADFHHRQALNAISQNQGLQAYNELVAAEKLNSVNDLYRTDLAQTNFALANAIAISKGPSDSAPSGTLTDQDKQNIQVLLNQAINEGRTATTLSPRSTINWEILGSLYRQISGVAQNALLFSLDSYGRAIQADPLNPVLRLNVGGVYYAIKNYDMAIRFFTDAVNLKPDYANGFYNLSAAYKDKGDLQSAVTAAQQVVKTVDKNSPDYKVASDYLKDLELKTQTAIKSANLTAQTVEDKGALQQKELPKVIELPKPEKIATPAAIKASPSPSATPIP